jgi:hypothetical protein
VIVITLRALRSLFERVEVSEETGCWRWRGNLTRGYARIAVAGKLMKAHRFVYQATVRELRADEVLDHQCRTRDCVNPAHLEPITNRQNTLRGIASRRALGVLPLFKEVA